MAPRFFSILFLLLLLPTAHAVGFMGLPTQREFIFEPGKTITIPLNIVKGEHMEAWTSTIAPQHPETLGTPQDDNILSYVTIEDPAPRTGPRQIIVKITMPEQLKPGSHTVDVNVADYPSNLDDAMISAVAMTSMRFTVRVLTEEPLLEVTYFGVAPIAEGLPANATMNIVSRTKQDIDRIQADIVVYNGTTELLRTTSKPVSLKSGELVSFNTMLPTEELPGGEYQVNATVRYADKEAYAPTVTLKVGTLHVDIPSYTKELTYNTTNKFIFNISNQWNRELQEVYGVVKLGSQSKKTASQNIPPFGETAYELYFDREETLAPGTTQANITVTYKDYDPKTDKYVNKEESFLLPVQIVMPPEPEKREWNMTIILTGAVIAVLILLLIAALILLFRKSRQPPGQPPLQPPASPPQ